MKNIALYDADQVDHLVWPENVQDITADSPAISVFTDFHHYEPLVIDADTLALDAEQMMKRSHVRLKLVIDRDAEFVGVIALDDLSDSEVIKKVANGFVRKELRVSDMMRRKQDLKVFHYDDLERMNVEQVLNVLKQYGHQHCLVVEHAHHQIRGIISASDIARKLKIAISIQQPPKFAELYLAAIHR